MENCKLLLVPQDGDKLHVSWDVTNRCRCLLHVLVPCMYVAGFTAMRPKAPLFVPSYMFVIYECWDCCNRRMFAPTRGELNTAVLLFNPRMRAWLKCSKIGAQSIASVSNKWASELFNAHMRGTMKSEACRHYAARCLIWYARLD